MSLGTNSWQDRGINIYNKLLLINLFGLRGREGKYSRVGWNWPKISVFSVNSTLLPSTPPLDPNKLILFLYKGGVKLVIK